MRVKILRTGFLIDFVIGALDALYFRVNALYPVIDILGHFQLLCGRHLRLFLRQPVQPLQVILET